MEVLWTLDDATVRSVFEMLKATDGKPRAYTTVMTVMHRLDRKGLVTRRRVGKADTYRPCASRSVYRKARAEAEIQALIEAYGDAAYQAMARRLRGRRTAG